MSTTESDAAASYLAALLAELEALGEDATQAHRAVRGIGLSVAHHVLDRIEEHARAHAETVRALLTAHPVDPAAAPVESEPAESPAEMDDSESGETVLNALLDRLDAVVATAGEASDGSGAGGPVVADALRSISHDTEKERRTLAGHLVDWFPEDPTLSEEGSGARRI